MGICLDPAATHHLSAAGVRLFGLGFLQVKLESMGVSFKTSNLVAEGQTLQNGLLSLVPQTAILLSYVCAVIRHVLLVSEDSPERLSQL